MDMQAMLKTLSEMDRVNRGKYHLTLGALIDELVKIDGNIVVQFDDGSFPGTEDSYRGYYSDLAFQPSTERCIARSLAKQCRAAAGSTYQGYKGGDFTMGLDTPLWCADYGCLGSAIVGFEVRDGAAVLITKDIDR